MEEYTLRLSVEELALVFTQLGQPELGRNLIISQLGENLNQSEVHARVMAASHSLMARGWMEIDADGVISLAAPLIRLAQVLTRSDFSLRYNRASRESEVLLTYHFDKSSIFKHHIEMGVIHSITEFNDTKIVVQDGIEFFSLSSLSPFMCPIAEVSSSLLDKLKPTESLTVILQKLEQEGVLPETRSLLAEDLHETIYRGSILRIEYDKDNAPVSNHGMLTLQGPERMWLLIPATQKRESTVTVIPGTIENFQHHIMSLINRNI